MAQRAVLPAAYKYVTPRIEFRWEGVFENYARSFVHRNFWRVREQFCSEEDALQECALVFADCLNRYAAKVDEPKWMMALFKRCLMSHWHTNSVYDTRKRSIPIPEESEQLDFNQGPLAVALADASDEVKQFLQVMQSAPSDFLNLIFADENVAALNQRIKRLCGIDKAVDIVAELRALLS